MFSAEPPHGEGTHVGDTVEVTVDMHDAEVVVQRRFGDKEVRNGDAMPQPMVVRKVSLKAECSVEDVEGSCNETEVVAQKCPERVVLAS